MHVNSISGSNSGNPIFFLDDSNAPTDATEKPNGTPAPSSGSLVRVAVAVSRRVRHAGAGIHHRRGHVAPVGMAS